MRELLMVRHGKSSWEYGVGDRDRPLLERGINDAILVSGKLAGQEAVIDRVFSSPANRALHTCTVFMRQLGLPWERLSVTDELYDFSGDAVMRLVRSFDDAIGTALIFGHNHAFTHLANVWGTTYIDNVPTSGLVAVRFDTDRWSTIEKGTTVQAIFPKQLR